MNASNRPKGGVERRPLSGSPIARWLDQLEASINEKFTVAFDAIRQLMMPPEPKKTRGVGFAEHIKK